MSRFRLWREHPAFDRETQAELAPLGDRPDEVEERFGKHLAFGTAGLRGVIGAGTNRMNRYVVRLVTSALAGCLLEGGDGACRQGVVIAHDSRRCSPEFAREAALVLAGAGVRAYLWESLRPTPLLSFAVRELSARAGVMITASHNPPEYNGYKVYWEDGGQVPPDRAARIEARMRTADVTAVPVADEAEARAAGLIRPVPEAVDRAYLDRLLALVPGGGRGRGACRIIYTPLHGTGNRPVRQVLTEAGFAVTVVLTEAEPDPSFGDVKSPNPEEPSAFAAALRLAAEQAERPDVIMATDPDADRLGVMVHVGPEDRFRLLSGNQLGALLVAYLLEQYRTEGRLPPNGAIAKSLATANMVAPICAAYGVALVNTHTGFKFIADRIREWEETGEHTFLFGFEESYGYLAAPFVRDKDAVMAALLTAEAAAYYKELGKSLWVALQELFGRYGHYREAVRSITLPGQQGLSRMAALMAVLRESPPAAFGPLPVACVDDYATGLSLNPATGQSSPLPLGRADVLHYQFADGGFVIVRPSGTEPKLKLYVSVVGADGPGADAMLEAVMAAAVERLGVE